MEDRDYQHSRPLDVHLWSEHTEGNKFVDYVYDTYLRIFIKIVNDTYSDTCRCTL